MISADTNGAVTNYIYGLERISAVTDKIKTEYIYDGRSSVAAEVSYNSAWYTLGGAIAKKNVTFKSYIPFGEQIEEQTSGFGFNGEYFDATTGQIYLHARFYEPEMARFGQKDIVRGTISDGLSLNRYAYVRNDPVNFIDPSGESLKFFAQKAGNFISTAASAVSKTAAVAESATLCAGNSGKERIDKKIQFMLL